MCLSVCLCVCVFTFEVLFKLLFPPTSQSRMSRAFRDLESMRISNGKKLSPIWKLLLIKGVISLRKRKFVFGRILQGSGGYTTRIRRLYNKDQEVIQHRSGGYTTRIKRLYNKDQEVMFSDAIIEPLQKTFAYKGCTITSRKKFVFQRILPY